MTAYSIVFIILLSMAIICCILVCVFHKKFPNYDVEFVTFTIGILCGVMALVMFVISFIPWENTYYTDYFDVDGIISELKENGYQIEEKTVNKTYSTEKYDDYYYLSKRYHVFSGKTTYQKIYVKYSSKDEIDYSRYRITDVSNNDSK